MTKRAKIENLYRSGVISTRIITQTTGSSYSYVKDILRDMRNPGTLAVKHKRWSEKNRDKRLSEQKKWRKRHPEKVAINQALTSKRHLNATFPHAIKRYQWWENEDIRFLRNHCSIMTIRELALALRRTYSGVKNKGHVLGFDMRGDKMGRRMDT